MEQIIFNSNSITPKLQTVDQNWSKHRTHPQSGHQPEKQHRAGQLLKLDLHLLGAEHKGGIGEESSQDVEGGEDQDEGPVLGKDDIRWSTSCMSTETFLMSNFQDICVTW